MQHHPVAEVGVPFRESVEHPTVIVPDGSDTRRIVGAVTAPPTTEARVTPRAHVAVGAVFFVHGLLFASWAAHIPHVKARLGVDDAGLGVALLGAPVGSVSAIGLMAWLVPRLGSRRMVQIALVGYCLSGPLIGVVGSVPLLFLALLVWGAFQGGLDIAMNTQAITVEKAKNRPLMNGMHAWWGIGAFAGAGVGTLRRGRRGPLSGAAARARCRCPAAVRRADAAHAARPAARARCRARGRAARRVSVAMLLLGGDRVRVDAVRGRRGRLVVGLPARHAWHRRGRSAAWATPPSRWPWWSCASSVTGWSSGTAPVPCCPSSPASATVVFAAALAVGAAPVAVVGFFVLGLGLGAVVPSAFSAAGRLPGIHPGVGVAAVSGLGWAGFVCGPPLIGALSGATSLTAALALVPVLTAFIAVSTRRVVGLQPTLTSREG